MSDTRPRWLRWLLPPLPASDVIRELEAQAAKYKARADTLELENELLAAVNENLRQWLLASTASARAVQSSLGLPPEEPTLHRNGRL